VIRILQEQTFNELADRILWVVEDLFGFGHGGVVWCEVVDDVTGMWDLSGQRSKGTGLLV